MNGRVTIAAVVLLLFVVTGAGAEVFLRGNAGWLEGKVYDTDTAGSPYLGGAGWSGEAGFSLFGRMRLSFEYGPSYRQPTRNIDEAEGLEDGSYQLMMGSLSFRMEPIESVEPYLILGGGQGTFTFDYGDSGKVVSIGGVDRRLMEEKLKGWVIAAGFGFEAPIASWLYWGTRGRFLYHRWRADTDAGRFLPFDSGNGYILEATLTLRF